MLIETPKYEEKRPESEVVGGFVSEIDKDFRDIPIDKKSPLELSYVRENEAKHRLVIFVPGLRGSSKDEMEESIKIRSSDPLSLRFNSLSMHYVGEQYSTEAAVKSLRCAINLAKQKDDIRELFISGSSFGSSIALALTKSLGDDPIVGISVRGVSLFVPAFSKELILGRGIKALPNMPKKVALRAIKLQGAIFVGDKNTIESSPSLIYEQIMELSENADSTELNSLKDTDVKIFLAENDEVIDSRATEDYIKTNLQNAKVEHLEINGLGHHGFANEKEMAKFQEEKLLPLISEAFLGPVNSSL